MGNPALGTSATKNAEAMKGQGPAEPGRNGRDTPAKGARPVGRASRGLRQWLRLAAILGLAVSMASGCVGFPEDERHYAVLEEGPLGGEALQQRKHDLDRAYRDMVHFHSTMQSLADRRDSRSLAAFDRFVEAYMGTHLDPLIASEWQSAHAELMARDASLRFMKAEMLIQMRFPRRVQRVRDEIERRYGNQLDLLIDYPVGEQGTLGRGLKILKDRKWRG